MKPMNDHFLRRVSVLLSAAALLPRVHGGELPSADLHTPIGGSKGGLVSPAESGGGWKFTLGAARRSLGDVSFDTGLTPAELPDLVGGSFFTPPPGIGETDSFADRTYDDGFVNIGAATPGTGLTTYWGYDNAGQVQGGQLVLTRTGGIRNEVINSGTVAPAGWNQDTGDEGTPYLDLAYTIPVKRNVSAGFGLNFMSVGLGGSRGGLNTFSQSQVLNIYDVTATDSYDLGGIIPPGAGYAGSFAGPGALIPNLPADREFSETLDSTFTANFRDDISESLDVDFHSLGFSGRIAWQPAPQVYLGAEGGLVLNLASWDASRDERILQSIDGGADTVIASRSLRRSGNDLLWGVFLQATCGWRIDESWSAEVFGRYDWNESLGGSIGSSGYHLDLSGHTLGIGVGYSF